MMTDNWQDWKTNPPPVITCHVREGLPRSVDLIIIQDDGDVWDDVHRDENGQCRCNAGGYVRDVVKWAYAPNAWDGIIIDKEKIELDLITRLLAAGYITSGDPEQIANDLADPPS